MPVLTLYQDYSRGEVHDIFAPHSPFTPQSGTWGLHGIIPIPGRPGDFIFFVTFGQQQGDHIFDEGITVDGVLSWQSQPRQTLATRQVQQFIHHDELTNTIYLFLRTTSRTKYTYLGRLKYVSHDVERENPVYFQWQILDWEIPQDVVARMRLILQPTSENISHATVPLTGTLDETAPPLPRPRRGTATATFRSRKAPDYSAQDARNRQLGLAGERLVIEHEKRMLRSHGRADLADEVRHVAVIEGDGAGYDIRSFSADGHEKYIEVKTTRGSAETPFYMTRNEVEFAGQHQEQYYLYRIYDYDTASDAGKVYVIAGKVEDTFTLTPIQYRVERS